eukprot:10109687-Lingulodinium_polyedra.AAC.1
MARAPLAKATRRANSSKQDTFFTMLTSAWQKKRTGPESIASSESTTSNETCRPRLCSSVSSKPAPM